MADYIAGPWKVFLVCGIILVIIGVVACAVCYGIALETVLPSTQIVHPDGTVSDAPGVAHSNEVIASVVLPIVAVGVAALGYLVTRNNAMPTWYILIAGIIPGFLLAVGWNAVHSGLIARKGLPTKGAFRLRSLVAIATVAGGLATLSVLEVLFSK